MAKERDDCAWCGNQLEVKTAADQHPYFCPECQQTFDSESHATMHTAEERHPHNN